MTIPCKRTVSVSLLALALCSSAALARRADEGMWTFDAPPREALEEKFGFEPTAEWLEHVRLSSVRLNDGGSGSFISPDGLVLTNHHVGFTAIQKLSSEERDLIGEGFYAPKVEDELTCTDLELNVLASMKEVTDAVSAAMQGAASEAEAVEKKDAVIAQIEKAESEQTGLRCNVIELYRGGKYMLYRYKKYTDVKLVFAPEQQAAFFGGDPDNFTFPRYCLDMAIFRVYEDGRPAQTPHYLRWNNEGAAQGDLVFVSGNPGSTGRLLTVAQLEYLRDTLYPMYLRSFQDRHEALSDYAERGEEQERRAKKLIFSLENSIKAISGYHDSLVSGPSMERKAQEEARLRGLVGDDAELAKAWDEIAKAQETARELGPRNVFGNIRGSQLFSIARDIVRWTQEVEKPNEERLPRYRDSNLESVQLSLFSEAPIYTDLEDVVLNSALSTMVSELGEEDPLVEAIRAQSMPMEASFSTKSSELTDVEYRRSLVGGGWEAVQQSTDPVIMLARAMDPVARRTTKRWDEEVKSIESRNGKAIAQARFDTYGTSVYPDATFTLRLSYGTVQGFETGGYRMPYKTTFNGLYERSAAFDNQEPFQLSEIWRERRSELDPATPFNFVSTCDIIGGNSGSPVVDREGRLVGLIFDGNIQMLGNRFVFDDSVARSVAVHTAGMMEALQKVYRADALVDEILMAGE